MFCKGKHSSLLLVRVNGDRKKSFVASCPLSVKSHLKLGNFLSVSSNVASKLYLVSMLSYLLSSSLTLWQNKLERLPLQLSISGQSNKCGLYLEGTLSGVTVRTIKTKSTFWTNTLAYLSGLGREPWIFLSFPLFYIALPPRANVIKL